MVYEQSLLTVRTRYTQEENWEDVPGKIGYVLGRHHAGATNTEIVSDVNQRFPGHEWVQHVKASKCIEFVTVWYGILEQRYGTVFHRQTSLLMNFDRYAGYTAESALVSPVLDRVARGENPAEIHKAANENGVGLDEICYIIGRFAPQPHFTLVIPPSCKKYLLTELQVAQPEPLK